MPAPRVTSCVNARTTSPLTSRAKCTARCCWRSLDACMTRKTHRYLRACSRARRRLAAWAGQVLASTTMSGIVRAQLAWAVGPSSSTSGKGDSGTATQQSLMPCSTSAQCSEIHSTIVQMPTYGHPSLMSRKGR